MKVLVSSTSWTPDEDFSMLLNALVSYSDLATSVHAQLPEVLAIITGKGPLKDAFLSQIQKMAEAGKLSKVHLRTAWLSAEDYAKLLASADLGVSLHTSSSGVDLPMKVVDMLGAGLPVVGWDKFEAWPELILEGINGRGFKSSHGLCAALVSLFGDDKEQLRQLRKGAILEGRKRWDDEWDPPTFSEDKPQNVTTKELKSAIYDAAYFLVQQIERLATANKHLPAPAKPSLTRLIDHKLQSIHYKTTQVPQDDEALGDLECFVKLRVGLRSEEVDSKVIDRIIQEKINLLLELNGLEVVVSDDASRSEWRDYGKDLPKASSLDPWVHVSFKINSFTFDEWPPQELASLADFSVGEEQSLSTVVALAWSPLALARHKRFSLAILTTNHVLSLWASTSDLRTASNWKRVLVINKALKVSPPTSFNGKHESNSRSSRHLERIRGMSWAPEQLNPSTGTSSSFGDTNPHHSSPSQYLAVTNDANEVIVLRIHRPWSNDGCLWEAQVAARASWETLQSHAGSAESKNTHKTSAGAAGEGQWSSVFASCLSKKAFIDKVTCLPWHGHQTGICLILSKNWQTLRVHLPFDSVSGASAASQWMPLSRPIEISHSHIRFSSFECSAATTSGKVPNSISHIALPSGASTIQLLSWEIPEKAADGAPPTASTEIASRSLSLANDWDEISGLAFTSIPGHVVLHVSSLLSGSFSFHIPPDVPSDGKDKAQVASPYKAAVQDQVSLLQRDFDRDYNLGGQSHAKTWGMASWNTYVASCITLHPSDMVEYSIPSDQRCLVIFSQENDSSGQANDAIFPWQEISNSVQRESCPAVLERVLDVLNENDMPQDIAGRKTSYNICCAAIISADIHDWKPVQEILQKLSVSTGMSLDAEISIVDEIKGSRVTLPQRIEKLREIASARIADGNRSVQQHFHSFCSFCEKLITWQSLDEAHYEAHAGRNIDDENVEQDEHAAVEMEIEQPATISNPDKGSSQRDTQPQLDGQGLRRLPNNLGLIATLSTRFDICPYCQGKFIG
ncbi:MAG: hypothetical protein Q9223_005562 [Gallowayella weberi]